MNDARVLDVKQAHSVSVINRESVSVVGVGDVLYMSDDLIELETTMGILGIKGENLRIQNVSKIEKSADIKGTINSMEYKKTAGEKSFIKSLFK